MFLCTENHREVCYDEYAADSGGVIRRENSCPACDALEDKAIEIERLQKELKEARDEIDSMSSE